MKLYYSAGSCSTSCHITLEESGLKYEAIGIDWENTLDPNTQLVTRLNPLETLPILITDEGQQLDQNIAIHTYVADKAPQKNLLPAHGTFERVKALNWLSFIASDLHKSIGGIFGLEGISSDKAIQSTVRKYMVEKSNNNLSYLDSNLSKKDYLLGSTFTAPDAYAFVVVGWTKWLEIPLTPYTNIQNYMKRIAARPAVQTVLTTEGLA